MTRGIARQRHRYLHFGPHALPRELCSTAVDSKFGSFELVPRKSRTDSFADIDDSVMERIATLRQRAGEYDGDLDRFRAAIADDPLHLILLLDARARARGNRLGQQDDLMPRFAWRVGMVVGVADTALDVLNTPWHSFREDLHDIDAMWLAELRSGLDTFAHIAWCLRFGYTLAGAALARRYIERWTYNIASSHHLRPATTTQQAYISEIWETHAASLGGRDVGEEWATLSELLHGRPTRVGNRTVQVRLDMEFGDRARTHSAIARTAEIALRQVRGAIHSALAAAGKSSDTFRALLQIPISAYPKAATPPDFLTLFQEPLDFPFVHSEIAHTQSEWGATYRRIVAHRALEDVDIVFFDSWMALEERWARSIDRAKYAFDQERAAVGIDAMALTQRLIRYRAISEMAHLAADDLTQPIQAQALRAASSALESAWALWLQDLDESLVCMRTVLECAARARVYRQSPQKVAKLTATGPGAPARWIDAAGWGPLAGFVKALGEMSHFEERSRLTGARQLLTDIQRDQGAAPKYTARGSALDEIASMLGHETALTLETTDPFLARRFRQQVLRESEQQSANKLAQWLQRAQEFRKADLGVADLIFNLEEDDEASDDATDTNDD